MERKIDLTALLNDLDGSGSDKEFNAIRQLRELGDELPELLLDKYKAAKKWGERSSCVYHSIRYARCSSAAVKLGVEALSDKSRVVRYRACMLLAYSLDKTVLPDLKSMEVATNDEETLRDLKAAIDAIESENSDYFVDREHSGKVHLKVG